MLDPAIIKREVVKVGEDKDGEDLFVSVRGLTAQDFAVLFNEEENALAAVLSDAFSWDRGDEVVTEIITRLPALAALTMGLACDEVESSYLFAQLPIPKQVEIMNHIYELTLPSADSKKKLVEGVSVIMSSFGFKS